MVLVTEKNEYDIAKSFWVQAGLSQVETENSLKRGASIEKWLATEK